MADDEEEVTPAADDSAASPGERIEGEQELRDEFLKNAHFINYQVFQGTVSAPNSTFGTGFDGGSARPAAATGPMRPADVAEALRHYVAPETFSAAQRILRANGLVVLCGPDGIGKFAGAVALLEAVAPDVGPPTNLSPALSFAELARQKFGKPGGYIVRDQLRGNESAAVQQFEVQRLQDAVRGRSWLVITTNLGARPRGRLRDLMVDWAAPAPGELFDEWATDLPPSSRSGPAYEEVRRHLDAMTSPADVVRVLEALQNGPEAALTGLRHSGLEQVSSWFEGSPSVDEVLGVAVLAFVEGTPEPVYETLLDRLKALYRETIGPIQAAPAAGEPATSGAMPQTRNRNKPGSLVTVGAVPDSGSDGVLAGRPVLFARPEMRELVLRELHDRYGYELWAPLRAWLDEVASRPVSPLHVRLGLGVALYSSLPFCFREVETTILDRWAGGLAPQRLAAATTLSWIGLSGQNAAEALGITKRWSQNSGQQRAVTAATALGGPLGLRYSSDALRWLWTLAMRGVNIREVASAALSVLFASSAEDPAASRKVLNFLYGQLRRSLEAGQRQRDRRATFAVVLSIISASDDTSGELLLSTILRSDESNAARLGQIVAELWCSAPQRAPVRQLLVGALEAVSGGDVPEPVRQLGRGLRLVLPAEQLRQLEEELRDEVERYGRSGIPITTVLEAMLGRRPTTTSALRKR